MNQNKGLFDGPVVMLLSAGIYGFFGFFYIDWSTLGVDGQPVLFRVLLGWTLKISACVFLLSGILALAKPFAANLLYSLAGIGSAGLFVVVAVMDVTDTRHGFLPFGNVFGPVVLLLFAAWNGFGSWSALRSILGSRSHAVAPGGGPDATDGQ